MKLISPRRMLIKLGQFVEPGPAHQPGEPGDGGPGCHLDSAAGPGPAQQDAARILIVLNFRMVNDTPSRPARTCRKTTGAPMLSRMPRASRR